MNQAKPMRRLEFMAPPPRVSYVLLLRASGVRIQQFLQLTPLRSCELNVVSIVFCVYKNKKKTSDLRNANCAGDTKNTW